MPLQAGTVELRDPRGIGRESGKGLAPLDRPHRRIEGLQNLSVRLAASSSDGANYVSMEVVSRSEELLGFLRRCSVSHPVMYWA